MRGRRGWTGAPEPGAAEQSRREAAERTPAQQWRPMPWHPVWRHFLPACSSVLAKLSAGLWHHSRSQDLLAGCLGIYQLCDWTWEGRGGRERAGLNFLICKMKISNICQASMTHGKDTTKSKVWTSSWKQQLPCLLRKFIFPQSPRLGVPGLAHLSLHVWSTGWAEVSSLF